MDFAEHLDRPIGGKGRQLSARFANNCTVLVGVKLKDVRGGRCRVDASSPQAKGKAGSRARDRHLGRARRVVTVHVQD